MSAPACPSCGTAIQPDWDWCYKCGFDPDNLRPADIGPAKPPDFGDGPADSTGGTPSTALALPATSGSAGGGPGPTTTRPAVTQAPDFDEPPPTPYPTFGPPRPDRTNLLTIGIGIGLLVVLAIGAVVFVSRSTQPPPQNDNSAAGTPNALAKNNGGERIVTTTTAPEWTPFTPPGGGFTVELPGSPSEQSRTTRNRATGEAVTVHQYTVGNDEENPVGVGYFDLPAGLEFDTDVIAGNLAALYGGAALDITKVDYAGLEGVDFTALSQLVRVRERILRAGKRVYILFAGRKLADTTGSEVDFIRLTNSLKLG